MIMIRAGFYGLKETWAKFLEDLEKYIVQIGHTSATSMPNKLILRPRSVGSGGFTIHVCANATW